MVPTDQVLNRVSSSCVYYTKVVIFQKVYHENWRLIKKTFQIKY